MSWPRMAALPAVGFSRPVSILIVVVFPAPLGPRKPTISLCPIVRSIPFTAIWTPYVLRSPRASTAGTVESLPCLITADAPSIPHAPLTQRSQQLAGPASCPCFPDHVYLRVSKERGDTRAPSLTPRIPSPAWRERGPASGASQG